MNIDVPDILEKLGDLLDLGWCQDTYARDTDGDPVGLHSDDATSFCLVGGARRLAGMVGVPPILHALCTQLDMPGPLGSSNSPKLADWNDDEDRTQKDVVKLCRDTAARVRAQP